MSPNEYTNYGSGVNHNHTIKEDIYFHVNSQKEMLNGMLLTIVRAQTEIMEDDLPLLELLVVLLSSNIHLLPTANVASQVMSRSIDHN